MATSSRDVRRLLGAGRLPVCVRHLRRLTICSQARTRAREFAWRVDCKSLPVASAQALEAKSDPGLWDPLGGLRLDDSIDKATVKVNSASYYLEALKAARGGRGPSHRAERRVRADTCRYSECCR